MLNADIAVTLILSLKEPSLGRMHTSMHREIYYPKIGLKFAEYHEDVFDRM